MTPRAASVQAIPNNTVIASPPPRTHSSHPTDHNTPPLDPTRSVDAIPARILILLGVPRRRRVLEIHRELAEVHPFDRTRVQSSPPPPIAVQARTFSTPPPSSPPRDDPPPSARLPRTSRPSSPRRPCPEPPTPLPGHVADDLVPARRDRATQAQERGHVHGGAFGAFARTRRRRRDDDDDDDDDKSTLYPRVGARTRARRERAREGRARIARASPRELRSTCRASRTSSCEDRGKMRCAPAMDRHRRRDATRSRARRAGRSRPRLARRLARAWTSVASWTTRVASICAPWARAWNQRDDGPRISRRARVDVDAGRSVRLARRVPVVHGG